MKSGSSISIHSVSQDDAYGFHPSWKGEAGEELGACPFSLHETNEVVASEVCEDDNCYNCRDLSGGNFCDANLEAASFSQAQLHHANFSRSRLRMADFTDADLTEARFEFADLTFAEMGGVVLTKADLRNADLCRTNLRSANLHGANLHGADLELAILTEADLRGADLRDADLRSARLAGAIYDEQTQLPFTTQQAGELGMQFRSSQTASSQSRGEEMKHD